MKTTVHFAASAVAGAGAWLLGGPAAGLGLLAFGTLLDIDHVEHYHSRGMPIDLKGLLGAVARNQEKLEKHHKIKRGVPASWAFPVLHCVELLFLTTLLAVVSGRHLLYGAAEGILLHLLMDIKAYPMSPRFFSLVWRGRNRVRLRLAWKTWKA